MCYFHLILACCSHRMLTRRLPSCSHLLLSHAALMRSFTHAFHIRSSHLILQLTSDPSHAALIRSLTCSAHRIIRAHSALVCNYLN